MNIEIKDSVTLNADKSYLVTSKVTYQDNIYYLLVEETLDDNRDIKFCKERAEMELVELHDEELIKTLLPLLLVECKKHITDMDFALLEKYIASDAI